MVFNYEASASAANDRLASLVVELKNADTSSAALQEARDLLTQTLSPEDRQKLQYYVAENLFRTFDYEASSSVLDTLRKESAEKSSRYFALATLLMAEIKLHQRDATAVSALATEAIELSLGQHSALLARARAVAVHARLLTGAWAGAVSLLFKSLSMPDLDTKPQVHSRLLHGKGLVLQQMGAYEQSLKAHQQAIALAEMANDGLAAGQLTLSLGQLHLQFSEPDRALMAADGLRQWAQQVKYPEWSAYIYLLQAAAYSQSAEMKLSAQATQQALTISKRLSQPLLLQLSQLQAAKNSAHNGEWNEAIEQLTSLAVFFQQQGRLKEQWLIQKALSDAYDMLDKPSLAFRHLRNAVNLQARMEQRQQNVLAAYLAALDRKQAQGEKLATSKPKTTPSDEDASDDGAFSSIAIVVLTLTLLFSVHMQLRVRQLKEKLNLSKSQLQDLTLKDPLTKLHNRRFFLSQINNEIAFALRKNDMEANSENKLGILVIDIDNFKKINDTHGHHIGDEILAAFAQRLSEVSRDSDLVIRWGGEEFVAVTRDVNGQTLARYTKRLLDKMTKTPFETSALNIKVTCSIGGCLLPLFCKNPKLLDWDKTMDLADQALYQAKENGRNQALIISSAQDYDYHESNDDKLSALISAQQVSVNCIFP